MNRRLARLGTLLGTSFLLILPACADSEGRASPDGGGAFIDAALEPPTFTDEDARTSGEGVCYDGIDNDADGVLDCAEPGCDVGEATLCCVGSSDLACCDATVGSLALTIPETCTTGPVTSCSLGADLVPFGADDPVIEAGALVPQGGLGQGGVALGGPIDPRAGHLRLTGEIVIPDTRCEDCVDAAGIAFVDEIPQDGARVTVRLGVLAVGARNELQVHVADEVVATAPLPPPGVVTVEIATQPDGLSRYRLTTDGGVVVLDDPVFFPETVVAVAFGRTANRAAEVGALSIQRAERFVQGCDVPSAVVRLRDPIFPSSTSSHVADLGLGRPSYAAETVGMGMPDRRWFATAVGGSIYLLRESPAGELVPPTGATEPGVLVAAPTEGIVRLSDPWLQIDGADFVVHYVATDEDGVTTLRRTTGPLASPGEAMEDPEPILTVTGTEGSPDRLAGVRRLGAPTLFEVPLDPAPDGGTASEARMILRVEDLDGRARLVQLRKDALDGWVFVGGNLFTATLHQPRSSDLFAFDRDDLDEPALVHHDGLFRVYYTGARGTRTALGVLVSADAAVWRSAGEVLGPSEDGFDLLGVSGAAPRVVGDGLELVYRGHDGRRAAFGRARPAGTMGE